MTDRIAELRALIAAAQAAHDVRRAIEDRAMERELEAAMKPGWEE